METILSGIQPSNNTLHLGNYIGAILNWENAIKNLKKEDKCYFMIADLHTMTSKKKSNELRQNIKNLLATYISCNIVPNEQVIFFQQSKIPAHCELCWILSTITPLGQLERMTQFKDKKGKLSTNEINSGLLFYPVLMAADILLYKTTLVPVGEDQNQHLELTRDLVDKFENIYEKSIFIKPKGLTFGNGKRIMSLGDATKKMSKSIGEDKDKIFLTDTIEQIAKKIKTAKTDSITGIYYDIENRPEVSNLINIYSSISNESIESINNKYSNASTKQFKDDLTEIIINKISPINDKINVLLKEENYLANIILKGNEIANEVSCQTLVEVKKAVGLL